MKPGSQLPARCAEPGKARRPSTGHGMILYRQPFKAGHAISMDPGGRREPLLSALSYGECSNYYSLRFPGLDNI